MKDNFNDKSSSENSGKLKRRDLLKGMASLPVLGFFGYEFAKSRSLEKRTHFDLIKEMDLQKKLPSMQENTSAAVDKEIIRIGIIGAGDRGTGGLLKHLGFAPKDKLKKMQKKEYTRWLEYKNLNVALTGVCEVFDLRAERALEAAGHSAKLLSGEKNLPNVRRYKHYHDMLESDDIDAVIIATPDHHHAQMTIDAIKAGKHVYCEKSPTRTEEEIYRMYDAIKGSDPVYQLGHQVRHNPIYPYAGYLIEKGVLGKVSLIEVTTNRNTSHGAWVRHLNADGSPKPGDPRSIDWDQWLGDSPKVPFSIDRYYNWTKYFDYATGLLGQNFSHDFDAVNGILHCGIPASCMCTGGIYCYKDGREIPDVMHAVFEYPDKGLSLLFSATLMNSRKRGRVFMGRDASMVIGKSLEVIADQNSEKYKDILDKKLVDTKEPMLHINSMEGIVDGVSSATSKFYSDMGLTQVMIDGEIKNVTHLHLKEWCDAIRNGGKVSCDIDWAFQEAITIQMAKKSYFEKREVKWDPINRTIV